MLAREHSPHHGLGSTPVWSVPAAGVGKAEASVTSNNGDVRWDGALPCKQAHASSILDISTNFLTFLPPRGRLASSLTI